MSGSKIKDDKQEYQYSMPFTTPSGHTLSFYDTPDNQRVVIRHTSGSHIEFKSDGSVFLKSVGDIHTHASVVSSTSNLEKGSDASNLRYDADVNLEVKGRLRIKCSEFDLEVGDSARCKAGTDFLISGNNIMEKATESLSMEATKSIYTDTKEERKRVVTSRSEVGTEETGGTKGGLNVVNLHGNAIIKNDDPNGGITLAAKGYMNLVCGQERIDLVGQYKYENLTSEGRATWTQKVRIPQTPGIQNISKPGGDYYFLSDATSKYNYSQAIVTPSDTPYGYIDEVKNGDYYSNVASGNRVRFVTLNEDITIGGIQRVTATQIYLN